MAPRSAGTPERKAERPAEDRDAAWMAEVVRFTARTLQTERPVPFGALIVGTRSNQLLVRRVNAVAPEHDPSSHAEVRTVRAACKKLKSISLRGYTLYSTCEPCAMCMANLLWSGIDRIVYGATIADAARHCKQIYIPAAEVAERSDMACEVTGPVARELAYSTLFTHAKMLQVFKLWGSGVRTTRC